MLVNYIVISKEYSIGGGGGVGFGNRTCLHSRILCIY